MNDKDIFNILNENKELKENYNKLIERITELDKKLKKNEVIIL